ncbi:ectoine/hydroxyectoine ABC transporter substrate-binding protein EhuB [Paraburkholderia sp. CNPSo 3157]|nr:ectoine/hydroxyectoine ABC transporter substrate-binding protein EhuB [Paraburkholderia franconis]
MFATNASAETTLERIQRTGEVRIGYANESPFAFTKLDGSVTGESPEVAKKVFAKLGVKKVDTVLTEWGSLIPGLRAGRFDVIASGTYVTPARCQQVAFSEPIDRIQDTVMTLPGNPKAIHSYPDVAKNPDLKLAVIAGSVELVYAKEAGVKEAQLLQVGDSPELVQAVLTRRADAAASTNLTMREFAGKYNGKVSAESNFTDDPKHNGYSAFAFRPEDTDLRDAVNKILKGYVGSEDHLSTISVFGFNKQNLPDKTTKELCAGKAQ